MTQQDVIDIATRATWISLEISIPILGVALIVGLVLALLMALTQVQEMTLTFIPKILAIVAVLALLGPWMLSVLITFTTDLFQSIPEIVKGG